MRPGAQAPRACGAYKRFAKQNLAAGRIYSARGSQSKGAPRKDSFRGERTRTWWRSSRATGKKGRAEFRRTLPCDRARKRPAPAARTSVLRSKTLPQGGFTPPEEVKAKGPHERIPFVGSAHGHGGEAQELPVRKGGRSSDGPSRATGRASAPRLRRVQAFCEAKPCRRADLLRPGKSKQRGPPQLRRAFAV